MTRIWISAVVLYFISAVPMWGQSPQELRTMPSSAEFLELANKAEDKVQSYEQALRAVEHYLGKDTIQSYSEAANNAHMIIATIRKNGMTNYGLVSLLSTLDDLTLDAARASRMVLLGMAQNKGDSSTATADFMTMMQAENGLYDISDLLLHAGLRFAAAEDDMMTAILKHTK
jgi:hypothetical protein